ncbi:hypothetical protein ACIQVE_03405 [Pseudomonas sp. NPDC098747]|uniref:alpha-pore-forming tripartite toxin MakABE regulator n=1 Tax=Pseudomonas sp. NPDC098747 TaxID=3364487 RepID=UPI00383B473E
MKEISVLIVVDVENALVTNDLGGNVYLIDNNKNSGSSYEGNDELVTACCNGQLVNWSVVGVVAENQVEINNFSGNMIKDKICSPEKTPSQGRTYWQGRVNDTTVGDKVQYSVELLMNGKQTMSFDPFLFIVKQSL